MRPAPPIMFGINIHKKQIEEEESLCNTIKMYCCIGFTILTIIYILVMIIGCIILLSTNTTYEGNKLYMIDDYMNTISGSQ